MLTADTRTSGCESGCSSYVCLEVDWPFVVAYIVPDEQASRSARAHAGEQASCEGVGVHGTLRVNVSPPATPIRKLASS